MQIDALHFGRRWIVCECVPQQSETFNLFFVYLISVKWQSSVHCGYLAAARELKWSFLVVSSHPPLALKTEFLHSIWIESICMKKWVEKQQTSFAVESSETLQWLIKSNFRRISSLFIAKIFYFYIWCFVMQTHTFHHIKRNEITSPVKRIPSQSSACHSISMKSFLNWKIYINPIK